MTPGWLIAFSFLSVLLAAALIGIYDLYRRVGRGAVSGDDEDWPLANLHPGDRLDVLDIPVSLPSEGFVLFTTEDVDSFSAFLSADAVARAWGYTMVALVRTGSHNQWLGYIGDQTVLASVVAVEPHVLEQAGITRVPLLVFVRDKLIRDAHQGLLTPSQIVSAFQILAAPLGSARSLDWRPSTPLTTAREGEAR